MTRLARDNTLARVMKLVAEAPEQKSPTQRFTETFARRFVPAVLIGTLLVIVLLPLVFQPRQGLNTWRHQCIFCP